MTNNDEFVALLRRMARSHLGTASAAFDQAADMMRGPNHSDVLNYVADMTFCGKDGEWHFKPGYDPQRVLDAIQQS